MRKALLSILAGLSACAMATGSLAAPPESLLDDGATCTTTDGGKACRAGSYCKREFGACVAIPKGEGVCSPVPDICADDHKPVCGCNGKTYPNACHAGTDGSNIAHEGSCNSSDAGKERH